MKYHFTIFFWLSITIGFSQPSLEQSEKSDTLNRADSSGLKTGYWIFYGKDKPKTYGYSPEAVVEEGRYVAGNKEGNWKSYYPNQRLKNEIMFVKGRPNGKFKTYFENGEIEEIGTWTKNHYVDSNFRYYPNKILAHRLFYNENGKQEGWQFKYYENEKEPMKYFMKNGVEVSDSAADGKTSNSTPRKLFRRRR